MSLNFVLTGFTQTFQFISRLMSHEQQELVVAGENKRFHNVIKWINLKMEASEWKKKNIRNCKLDDPSKGDVKREHFFPPSSSSLSYFTSFFSRLFTLHLVNYEEMDSVYSIVNGRAFVKKKKKMKSLFIPRQHCQWVCKATLEKKEYDLDIASKEFYASIFN